MTHSAFSEGGWQQALCRSLDRRILRTWVWARSDDWPDSSTQWPDLATRGNQSALPRPRSTEIGSTVCASWSPVPRLRRSQPTHSAIVKVKPKRLDVFKVGKELRERVNDGRR